MNEATLKAALVKEAREALRGWVIIRHEDHFTHGIPDISFTGLGQTTWIEAKYANPKIKMKGIQELTMKRLAAAGRAKFLIYWEKGSEKRTYLVDPADIGNPMESWTKFTDGFNHIWVVEYIKGDHGDTY